MDLKIELELKNFRGRVLKRILGDKLTHYNDAIFDFSDEEIKQKKLWRNEAPIPSEKEIEKEWKVYKKELQKKLDIQTKKENQDKDNSTVNAEFDTLFDELSDQDEDLGLPDKQRIKLNTFMLANKRKKALNILKKSSLIKKKQDNAE